MFVSNDGSEDRDRLGRIAYQRGSFEHHLGHVRVDKAIACLAELHRLGAPRLVEAARIVSVLHNTGDPRAEQWLVRLVARIAIEQELDLDGLDAVVDLAMDYRRNVEARDALEAYCRQRRG